MPEAHPSPTPSDPAPEGAPTIARPIARWRWWVHLLLIASYVVFIGAVGFTRYNRVRPALYSSMRELLWTSAVELLTFSLVFGGAWLASRASRDELLLRWRRGFWPVPWGIGYSLALRLGAGVIAVVLAVVVGIALIVLRVVRPDELQSLFQSWIPPVHRGMNVPSPLDNPAYFWLMVTLVSFVVAGLREELWRAAFLAGLRGVWPRRFASRSGQLVAVALVAVVFGFGHAAQGPIAATMAGLIGFGLGVIMIVHRSIWPAVIAHGCFNATNFALIPFVTEKMRELPQAIPS